jgi:hypothetical protein
LAVIVPPPVTAHAWLGRLGMVTVAVVAPGRIACTNR